ncbi:MAG: hypothetical protein DRI93_04810 [Aquificota bacterium]|nr:MAG: hypothetical protein DRI93_04810 [Aquificota bacterium]
MKRNVDIGLEGVRGAIIHHAFNGHPLKTFLVTFETKRKVLSTQDGFKEVKFVGNNHAPQELWGYVHKHFDEYRLRLCHDLGITLEDTAMLFTGADVDNICIVCDGYRDVRFCACITAGVRTNAQRIGVDKASSVEIDEGKFENIDTVNVILLTNAHLSGGAMARSLITITEAKTIAFQDLDIRSSYNPALQATGTGTDSIIVVGGLGPKITFVGGHTLAGETMARIVTHGVKEAILKSEPS